MALDLCEGTQHNGGSRAQGRHNRRRSRMGFVAAKWALEAGAFPTGMHSGRSSTDRCLD